MSSLLSLTSLFSQFRAAFKSAKKTRSKARISATKYYQDLSQFLEQRSLMAGTPFAFDNIAPGLSSSNVRYLTNVNGTIYFSALNSSTGFELWRVNANATMAELVSDINSGHSSSIPDDFININGTLYFEATDGNAGRELWRVNNTTGMAELVRDIHIGSLSSYPSYLTNVNGTLYFSANETSLDFELWRINNTNGMAERVGDIFTGPIGSIPRNLTNVNGTLFFTATANNNGTELHKVNNTTGMIEIVTDINIGTASSSSSNLTNINGTLFFTANNGISGTELWRVNNTTSVAELVADINPGALSSSITRITNSNGIAYFTADDGTNGVELWRVNNVSGIAELVTNINPGNASSSPVSLTDVNGTIYFSANDGTSGIELWRVNNTTGIAELVTDINSGISSSNIANLANINGTLFFSANDGTNGTELWRVNNSTSSATIIDIHPGTLSSSPGSITEINGSLYFSATSASNGSELWMLNNTTNLPELIDVNPGAGSSTPGYFTNVNGILFFVAFNSTVGRELFKLTSPAEIEVSFGSVNIPDNNGPFNFGTTFVGAPISRTFTIRNTGADLLTIGNVSVTTGFTISQQPTSPIAPGGFTSFTVLMSAAAIGNPTGTISFTTNDADESMFDFTITGTVVDAPSVQIFEGTTPILNNTGIVDFGITNQGTPVSKTLTITNTGSTVLNVGAITVPTGYTLITPPPATIAAGGSANFVIQLNALNAGTFNSIFSFVTNDTEDAIFSFFVNGTVAGATVNVFEGSITPVNNNTSVISFGATFVGSPVTKFFTITNSGPVALTLSNVTVPTGFSILGQPASSLPPGFSTTFEVRLDALAVGPSNGLLTFTTNDINNPTFSFRINGTVLGSVISVFDDPAGVNNQITNNSGIISFGNRLAADAAVQKTFAIRNTGNDTLFIYSTSLPAGFTMITPPPASLAASALATFTVSFSSTTPGIYSGNLALTTNDPDDRTFNFNINGTVVGSEISVSEGTTNIPNSKGIVSFGGTFVGTPVIKTFTITNSSNLVTLTMSNFVVPPGFTLVTPPPGSIAPNSSGTFQVRMDANVYGPYNGLLTFNVNDADDPVFRFRINGTVLGSDISVSEEGTAIGNNTGIIGFGGRFVGDPLIKTFVIRNNGNIHLAPGAITVPQGFTVIQQPPASIAARGGTATFQIRLDANTQGKFNGTLSFVTNDADDRTFSFKINGTVLGSEISVFDDTNTQLVNGTSAISFGSTFVGTTVQRTFTITNTGTIHLAPGAITVPEGFTVITQPPASIPVGGSATFTIQFNAPSVGPFNGTLSFVTNDANDRIFSFNVSGIAQSATISVFENNQLIPNNTGISSFGGHRVGDPLIKNFRVRNTGNIPLAPGLITVPAGFTVLSQLPTSIPVGGEAFFQIRFDATTPGIYNGRVIFVTNDSTKRTFIFNVNGTVYVN